MYKVALWLFTFLVSLFTSVGNCLLSKDWRRVWIAMYMRAPGARWCLSTHKEGGRGRRFKINNQEREEFVYGSCIIKYEVSAI